MEGFDIPTHELLLRRQIWLHKTFSTRPSIRDSSFWRGMPRPPGLPDFSWYIIPKRGKMYQMNTKCTEWLKNIPNGCKIFQIAINYINIFQSRALQNLPKVGFLVWKETIWQPCRPPILTLLLGPRLSWPNPNNQAPLGLKKMSSPDSLPQALGSVPTPDWTPWLG
jgi:hypothetical protein